ncbi:alpha/beta fold hydrolase [uncultured Sunxiuqinia sp.]|uniref:alpha/beta hydrolase n=1 Tax=uncultured Sunxiuqinia sp. TaxID=1573825 RepID=UPI0030DB1065
MKTITCIVALSFIFAALIAQTKSDPTFLESEMVLKTSTGDLFGTLTIPEQTQACPIVLIVPGSGPTDRDGNSAMGLQTNAYKMLSEDLAKNGIATLRFDKRGIGKSKPAMASESELTFETYIDDVVAWILRIKSDQRFATIAVLGHSEGSLIGMIAAQQTNAAGLISLSGVGKSADKLLQEQLKTKLPPQLLNESNKILDSLRIGKTVSNVDPSLLSLYRPSVQPYMISWIKYDPQKEIGKLKMPVFIIQGSTDLQVSVEDAKLLSSAKPDAKLLIIDNMNHVLKESDSDIQSNMATYSNPALPLKAGLIDELVHFITTKK